MTKDEEGKEEANNDNPEEEQDDQDGKQNKVMQQMLLGLNSQIKKQKNDLQKKRSIGLIYFVIPQKGKKWHTFVHLQRNENGTRPVKDSILKLDPEKVERHRMIVSENCFHHMWDPEVKSFYFQRCYPVHKKCLFILDLIMNKFITVDDKKVLDMQEENLPEIDESEDYDYSTDAVTVTSRTLSNYGCYFEKQLPLHKLALMPKYQKGNKQDLYK